MPAELADRRLAPSYKAIAVAILKNDHALTSLGYSPPRSAAYDAIKRQELKNRMSRPDLVTAEMPAFSWEPPRDKPKPSYLDRTVSLTSVISRLCVDRGIFKPDDGKRPMNRVYLELGNALERALSEMLDRKHPGRFLRLSTIQKDIVRGRPDLIDTAEDDWVVDEIKCTWMSARQDVEGEKFWRYWVQPKAYCKMLGLTRSRLRVCFIVGDYRGSEPQYREWFREFTQREIDENWRLIKTTAEKMLAAKAGN